MDFTVFIAVLLAAVMHAGWNVLVKLKLDRFLSLCLIQTLMGVMGLGMLAVFPWPDPACLPYALASGVLHLGYNLFLARSYRTGDLSQVYPSRAAPLPCLPFSPPGSSCMKRCQALALSVSQCSWPASGW